MKPLDVMELPVHPAAEVFPMLPDDELDELAEDIKEHGLQQPIVVKDGVLIDGRNRREACRRAGVQPKVSELNGQDPVAFIISCNVNRRHLTTGQRAMAVAMLYPEGHQGKKGASFATKEVTETRISKARTVLKWARELADGVLNGAPSLDVAYENATQRKNAAEGPRARLESLRKKAPDLADKVVEEQLKLDEAEAAERARRERERAERQAVYDGLEDLARSFDIIATPKSRSYLLDILNNHGDEIKPVQTRAMLRRWHDSLAQLLEEDK